MTSKKVTMRDVGLIMLKIFTENLKHTFLYETKKEKIGHAKNNS